MLNTSEKNVLYWSQFPFKNTIKMSYFIKDISVLIKDPLEKALNAEKLGRENRFDIVQFTGQVLL